MRNWDKITLGKFQQIDAINEKPLSDIDKVLFSTCIVFDKTEHELDNEDPVKVVKMTEKLTKIFQAPFEPSAFPKIGKYFINYDISKVTLGQFIELNYFMQDKPVQHAHYILASVSNKRWMKNKASDHRRKAEYFLTRSIAKIMGSLQQVITNFQAFNEEYKKLFGLDKEVSGDVQEDAFNKRYGWIYSASQIAEYERITLDEAYAMNIKHAFNDLAFLKAKGKYEVEQLKKKTPNG